MSSSYQDAVGIDGEAIEFEWTISKDFHHCPNFKNPRRLGEKRKIQPEEFTDRIINMPMFNDIVWNANDENCISNAGKVKNYTKRFLAGHWTFLGPGSEEKWSGSTNHDQKRAMELHSQQNGATIQRNWSTCTHRNQCTESWSLEARERLKVLFASTEIL